MNNFKKKERDLTIIHAAALQDHILRTANLALNFHKNKIAKP